MVMIFRAVVVAEGQVSGLESSGGVLCLPIHLPALMNWACASWGTWLIDAVDRRVSDRCSGFAIGIAGLHTIRWTLKWERGGRVLPSLPTPS